MPNGESQLLFDFWGCKRRGLSISHRPVIVDGEILMGLIVTEAKNIADAFFKQAAATPSSAVYSQAIATAGDYCSEQARQWKQTTFESVRNDVCAVAEYLQLIGVESETSVAIISASRPEWMLADLAVMSCGGG